MAVPVIARAVVILSIVFVIFLTVFFMLFPLFVFDIMHLIKASITEESQSRVM